jgi:hypothetical protein
MTDIIVDATAAPGAAIPVTPAGLAPTPDAPTAAVRVDATKPAGTALPLDTPALPFDAEPQLAPAVAAAVATYEAAERAAAAKLLATPDGDLAAVAQNLRPTVTAVLKNFADAAEAVRLDRDLNKEARDRKYATLVRQRQAVLAEVAGTFGAQVDAAEARARTFVPDPPTDADARVVSELVRQHGELLPKYFVPILSSVIADPATNIRAVRQLIPYMKSWYENGSKLGGNDDLRGLVRAAERLVPDRNTLIAAERLRQVNHARWLLGAVAEDPAFLLRITTDGDPTGKRFSGVPIVP